MALSHEAQAIWDAFNEDEAGVFVDYGDKLAAALRAAADQVVPVEVCLRRGMRPGGTGSIAPDEFRQDQRQETRRWFLAIAAELESE
jgi:hypothetical protein